MGTVGKFMIAAALIPCENEDKLFATGGSPGWYRMLFQKMNCPFDQFGQNQVRFITYNYDRSLEHFLTNALAESCDKGSSQTLAIMQKIKIVHVHGCLGTYEVSQQTDRCYRHELRAYAVSKAANGIKIVHENVQDTPELNDAREALKWAEQIFFIGFGYDPINISRLRPETWVTPGKVIRGTALGMTFDEQARAIRDLMTGKPENVVSAHTQVNTDRINSNPAIKLGIDLEFKPVDAITFIRELPWSELGLDNH